jgi:alpha-glucosidase
VAAQTATSPGSAQAPTSILNLYRQLLWLRRQSPALYGGSYRPLTIHNTCFVYLRQTADQRYLIALNFADEACELDLGNMGNGRLVLSTHLDREEEVAGVVGLRPYEGVVVELF